MAEDDVGPHAHWSAFARGGLSTDAMRRAHEAARAVMRGLVDRGRREGTVRTDLPAAVLVTSCLALIHATAEGTRAGELDADAAANTLSVLVSDLLVGRGDDRDRD